MMFPEFPHQPSIDVPDGFKKMEIFVPFYEVVCVFREGSISDMDVKITPCEGPGKSQLFSNTGHDSFKSSSYYIVETFIHSVRENKIPKIYIYFFDGDENEISNIEYPAQLPKKKTSVQRIMGAILIAAFTAAGLTVASAIYNGCDDNLGPDGRRIDYNQ